MDYTEIVRYYENCYLKNGDNFKGVDWPNEKDAGRRYAVMMDIVEYGKLKGYLPESPALLDFGCGLGHLYRYISRNNLKYKDIKYTGLDLSGIYLETCRKKYPGQKWIRRDILKEDTDLNYDYIVLNGVFTEKREFSFDEFFVYFKSVVARVYKCCNYGIAFNVMSSHVEWERDDLFHLPMDVLGGFLTKEITRNFIIRNDYGLYEYTVYVFKECAAP